MRPPCVVASVALLFASASVCVAQVPGFHPVGFPVDGYGSTVTGLSANGAIASGTAFLSSNNFAFTWTLGGGRNEFGREAGLPSSTGASAISGDGLAVVGDDGSRAFRYQGPGTYQAIARIGGYTATAATGVSGDGSVVAGSLLVNQSLVSQVFRWSQAGGIQGLGYARPTHSISWGGGVSRDGRTIVGGSGGVGNSEGFAWRQSTGMIPLPSLSGSTSSTAIAVNFDGSIIVGQSGPDLDAVLWRDGQISSLGRAPGLDSGPALAVSDDGAVVVGQGGFAGGGTIATIWTPTVGMERLDSYLARNGIQVPSGWTLLKASAVSADGLTIAGEERSSAGVHQGFVVTIPAPGPLALGLLGAATFAVRRRRT